MQKNLGSMDRAARGLVALGMVGAAWLAPLETMMRIGLGATGAYLLFSAIGGTCLGYRVMGVSTCPAQSR